MNELSGTHNVIPQRASDFERLVQRKEFSFPHGSTRSHCLHGRRWPIESGHRQTATHLPAYGSIMATTVFITSPVGPAKRCAPPRSNTENPSTQNRRGCCRHATQQACQCNPLEHAQHGRGSRIKSIHRDAHLETTQPKTAFDRDIQTQQRQTFFREAPRCGRPLSKPSRQSTNLMCRREKSNPSIRTHKTLNTITPRHCGPTNTRLYTPWNDNFIRGFKHDRWQSHRRLHAPAPTSRIHSVFAIDQCQDSNGFGSTSYCRQLRNSQTCSREGMAETSSQIPFAFYSNIQFVAQHGRTLVPRNHRQANPSRLVQKCSRADQRHYAISRESQPKSTRLYLERIS